MPFFETTLGVDVKIQKAASEIFRSLNSAAQIEPFSKRGIRFSQEEAYAVAREVATMRGGHVLGRKIGFTNRSIWPIYNVHEPIWGVITDKTIEYASGHQVTVNLSGFCEPRLEPEIVLGLNRAIAQSPSISDIVDCVAWIAPGFEIVDSVYPNWDFALEDTIISGGLHGRLIVGQKYDPPENLEEILNSISVELFLNDKIREEGLGSNVLDGPISALKYLQKGIENHNGEPELKPGDVVTTGTLTDAMPILAGEEWSAVFSGFTTMHLSIKCI